jgi:hypothetical protein
MRYQGVCPELDNQEKRLALPAAEDLARQAAQAGIPSSSLTIRGQWHRHLAAKAYGEESKPK